MLLLMMGLLDVANCLMVLSFIMFGSGSDEGSKDIFVNGGNGGIVSVVPSYVEGVLSVEHSNSSLLRALRKFRIQLIDYTQVGSGHALRSLKTFLSFF